MKLYVLRRTDIPEPYEYDQFVISARSADNARKMMIAYCTDGNRKSFYGEWTIDEIGRSGRPIEYVVVAAQACHDIDTMSLKV